MTFVVCKIKRHTNGSVSPTCARAEFTGYIEVVKTLNLMTVSAIGTALCLQNFTMEKYLKSFGKDNGTLVKHISNAREIEMKEISVFI